MVFGGRFSWEEEFGKVEVVGWFGAASWIRNSLEWNVFEIYETVVEIFYFLWALNRVDYFLF